MLLGTRFRPYDWTDDALLNANEATAAAGEDHTRIYSGNQINALICEVQAWRRGMSHYVFVSGPNELRMKLAKQ